MTLRKVFLTMLLVICSIVFTVNPALAYVVGDYHWDATGTTYYHYSLPGDWQQAIQYAANTWNQAGANFAFTASYSSGNNLYTENMSNYPSTLASSGGTYVYGTNHFATCFTKFNTYITDWHTDGSNYDVQTVALHEMGHWLRLNHDGFWPWDSRVMYANYNGVKRSLHQDDIDGINAIYP